MNRHIESIQDENRELKKRIAEVRKENNELRTKLSEYASELWVLQELKDRASNMDVDSYTDTYSVKWYANRINREESK